MWMCETNIAMSFLILASDTTIAMCGDNEDKIVISSSCWEHAESFFALLAQLNVNWSWKMLMTLEPRLSSESRGENDGKILCNLLYESMRYPLMEFFWRSVSILIKWGKGLVGTSSMRVLIIWFFGRAAERSWDLLGSFCRWSLIGMRPAIASSSSVGDVLNAPRIQTAALLYIFPSIFKGYERGALL